MFTAANLSRRPNVNMLRRIVSRGQFADDDQSVSMPSSPGDENPPQAELKITGGIASVFKGLAGGSKLTKAPPNSSIPSAQASGPSISAQVTEQLKAATLVAPGLPQQHLDVLNQLKDSASTSDRVAAAATLQRAISDYPLNPVLDIWYAAKDLISPINSPSTRAAGWELLTACVKHPSSTGLERKEFFDTVSSPANPQDFHYQLTSMVELTRNGRNVSGFDYEVFPLVSAWLSLAFDIVKSARSTARKAGTRSKGKDTILPEEQNFSDLFSFVMDLIKFNYNAANEEAAETLVESLLRICMAASVEGDLKACIDVLESIVTYGAIPQQKHKNCVQVLSSIHCLIPALEKASWHTFRVLCRSHNGAATVRQLIEVLTEVPDDPENTKQSVRGVRGAISILQKLVAKSSEKGYPTIPFTLLVDGLSKTVTTINSWRIQLDIIRLLNVLFEGEHTNVNALLADEDWAPLLQVAVSCANTAIESISGKDDPPKALQGREDSLTPEIVITDEVLKLVSRIETLINSSATPLLQREDCINFLAKLHQLLPDSAALAVLDYYKEFRCCFPSDAEWETKLESVLNDFFTDKGRSTEVRSRALQIVTELYDMIELIPDHIEAEFVPELIKRLLVGVSEETDAVLLEELVAFSAAVAVTADEELFRTIIDTLRGVIGGERLRTPLEPESVSSASSSTHDTSRTATMTPSNVVTKGFVKLFVTIMGHDAVKAIHLFGVLVSIAKMDSCEIDARLTAMKLLFRIRADWANRIFVISDTESIILAAFILRTEAALLRRQTEEASQATRLNKADGTGPGRPTRGTSFSQLHPADRLGATRSVSGVRSSVSHYQHLWSLPDNEVLPPGTSQAASPVLLTVAPGSKTVHDEEQPAQPPHPVLPSAMWLEAILELMRQGTDWEAFSYLLVHLPSQLSNHALFKTAIPQIQELRRLICEQLRTNSLQEPPNAFGLRRADVAIMYFQSLTMLISYHEHFQKPEEDDIVRTFVQGIAHWERSAKGCIHALSICCHELPSSTTKLLVTMLSKMSQIITQPYVAMHILEFLTCLSRLPDLYANFHQDEFRIVFGICFRYLQYAREKRQSHRSAASGQIESHSNSDQRSGPNAADDLPQYVYALAYHVIIYWFLALKLQDRATHVGWIAKNLFVDADGSQASDEQAQTTIDFMQRVTYADVYESAADPHFTSDRFGPISKKRWLVGNSIVTVEQATASGWAQITKRHPSGTSSYMIRENYQQPPPHQKGIGDLGREDDTALANVILPNHLLVSLLTSLPQGHDHTRPIPLPDDDTVSRAIRMFDHNPTVDGHKVGVIYIGEGQSDEVEILANVSGSSDYVEFMNRLGTLTKLEGATFNTQGLDRQYGTDGKYAFCWRDRVTEMVFHVTTQMPTNLEHDPRCTLKKRHIGNDFVNIIFNDSGSPFRFDTFPSEFNYVNIVITPESRGSFVATRLQQAENKSQAFYKVQVMSKPGFPEISPAADTKIVSLKALPAFIRLLALNASVFSLVWAHRDSGGDNISPWRNRLKEIIRLREKFGLKALSLAGNSQPGTSALGGGPPAASHNFHPHPFGSQDTLRMGNSMRDSFSSLRRSSVATFFSSNSDQPSHASHRSSLASTTTPDSPETIHATIADSVVDSVDFSKWA